MNTIDNLPIQHKKLNASNTTNSFTDKIIGDIEPQELLVETNKYNGNQTQVESDKSSSRTLDIKSESDISIFPPQPHIPKGYFNTLQKWEGYVLEVHEDEDIFLARLIPMEGQGGDQEAEIYLSEITDEDRKLVKPGAVFYWSIGYLVKDTGQKIRASIIRFQRLSVWTQNDLNAAEADAYLLEELFDTQ